jgi:hypothetical protein
MVLTFLVPKVTKKGAEFQPTPRKELEGKKVKLVQIIIRHDVVNRNSAKSEMKTF